MPPITSTGFSLSDYRAQTSTTDPTTDFVQPGESTMSNVAERLRVDLNSLLKANPQIADPNQLTPGQEIQLPQPQAPGPLLDNSPVATQPSTPNLPPRPIGASDEAYAMKAMLQFREQSQRCTPDDNTKRSLGENAAQTSFPDTDSPEWQHQQVGINLSAINSAGEEAAKNEALAAKQRLNDLGLPPDPPEITSKDLVNRGPQGIPADEKAAENADERSREWSTEGAIDLYKDVGMHWGEKAVGWAVKQGSEMAEAAGESDAASFIEKIGGVGEAGLTGLSIGGALSLVANGVLDWIQDGRDATNARENAMTEMHGAAISLAAQLVQEKFPQVRPLNERGIGQLKDAIDHWKQGIDGSLNDTLTGMQNDIDDTKVAYERGAPGAENLITEDTIKPIIDDAMAKLRPVLSKGTVDLANAIMAVEYDPRNWNEPQSVGVTAK